MKIPLFTCEGIVSGSDENEWRMLCMLYHMNVIDENIKPRFGNFLENVNRSPIIKAEEDKNITYYHESIHHGAGNIQSLYDGVLYNDYEPTLYLQL